LTVSTIICLLFLIHLHLLIWLFILESMSKLLINFDLPFWAVWRVRSHTTQLTQRRVYWSINLNNFNLAVIFAFILCATFICSMCITLPFHLFKHTLSSLFIFFYFFLKPWYSLSQFEFQCFTVSVWIYWTAFLGFMQLNAQLLNFIVFIFQLLQQNIGIPKLCFKISILNN